MKRKATKSEFQNIGGDGKVGFFDFLKPKSEKTNYKYMSVMSGRTPIFSQFGTDVYASDVVQQAISSIVFELKKLDPIQVRGEGADSAPVKSSLNKVLKNPNKLMTTTEFVEKVSWLLFLNYNAFIYIKRDISGQVTELFPLNPTQVDFIEDSLGTVFVKFRFGTSEMTVPYDNLIHLRYKFSVSDVMGGNTNGQPDNTALLKTLSLNQTLLEGVAKAMKSSYAVNGVVKYNTLIDREKVQVEIDKLEKALVNSESGIMGLDLKSDFVPLNREIQLVDNATIEFIDAKILRHFGVSLPILTGDYTKEQYDAFYQKTLEPLIKSFGQAFTKALLTQGERDHGNEIRFYSKELIFMTTSEKLEMIRLLGDSGALYENEKRHAFGLQPLPELQGVRMMSLNYVNVDNATQYQIGEPTPTNNGGEGNE